MADHVRKTSRLVPAIYLEFYQYGQDTHKSFVGTFAINRIQRNREIFGVNMNKETVMPKTFGRLQSQLERMNISKQSDRQYFCSSLTSWMSGNLIDASESNSFVGRVLPRVSRHTMPPPLPIFVSYHFISQLIKAQIAFSSGVS